MNGEDWSLTRFYNEPNVAYGSFVYFLLCCDTWKTHTLMWCLLLVVSTLPDNNWPDAASFAICSLFEHLSTCSSKFGIAGNLWLMAALCTFFFVLILGKCMHWCDVHFWFCLLCQTATEQMQQVLRSAVCLSSSPLVPVSLRLLEACGLRQLVCFLFYCDTY